MTWIKASERLPEFVEPARITVRGNVYEGELFADDKSVTFQNSYSRMTRPIGHPDLYNIEWLDESEARDDNWLNGSQSNGNVANLTCNTK